MHKKIKQWFEDIEKCDTYHDKMTIIHALSEESSIFTVLSFQEYTQLMNQRHHNVIYYDATRIFSLLKRDFLKEYLTGHPDFGLVKDIACQEVLDVLLTYASSTEPYEVVIYDMIDIVERWGADFPMVYSVLSIYPCSKEDPAYFQQYYRLWRAIAHRGIKGDIFTSMMTNVYCLPPELSAFLLRKQSLKPLLDIHYPKLTDFIFQKINDFKIPLSLLRAMALHVDDKTVFQQFEQWASELKQGWPNEILRYGEWWVRLLQIKNGDINNILDRLSIVHTGCSDSVAVMVEEPLLF